MRRKAAERLADLIDPDRGLRELAAVCYSNVQDLVDAEGRLLPIRRWPRWAAASVGSAEVRKRNLTAGNGIQEDVLAIKLWDKPRALQLLLSHLGLLTERIHVSTDDELVARLAGARKRVGGQ